MNGWSWLTVFSAFALLLISLLHWVPWHKLLRQELRPPWTYVAGLLPLLTLHTGWALTSGHGWQIALAPWAIIGAAGVGCIGAYQIDQKAGDRLYKRVFGEGGTDGLDDRTQGD